MIIETGNHIAHSSGDRKFLGEEFAQIMIDSADENSPYSSSAKRLMYQLLRKPLGSSGL